MDIKVRDVFSQNDMHTPNLPRALYANNIIGFRNLCPTMAFYSVSICQERWSPSAPIDFEESIPIPTKAQLEYSVPPKKHFAPENITFLKGKKSSEPSIRLEILGFHLLVFGGVFSKMDECKQLTTLGSGMTRSSSLARNDDSGGAAGNGFTPRLVDQNHRKIWQSMA